MILTRPALLFSFFPLMITRGLPSSKYLIFAYKSRKKEEIEVYPQKKKNFWTLPSSSALPSSPLQPQQISLMFNWPDLNHMPNITLIIVKEAWNYHDCPRSCFIDQDLYIAIMYLWQGNGE